MNSDDRGTMTGKFAGKVALVTGGAGGIGLASAREFGRAGAAVVIADRDEELLASADLQLRNEGMEVLSISCDVSDTTQVKAMLEAALRAYGRLDAAFNNAGLNCDATPMAETDDELFERLMNTNLRGVWNCMKAELPPMLAQGSGAIVNCSSIGGIVGSPGRTAYSASKHGIIGLTMSAANEYVSKGILINAVCPGMVDTPMMSRVTHDYDPEIVGRMTSLAPIGRFGRPEEIAAAVIWLCSPGASFICGHVLVVDGGFLTR
ncbi:MAG: glucose 1-dehydrogenase [Burkholderiaceae bacterium]|jgi:NAD(P)-dependent dehydrogenase (short-subunit alcohol dehydrogenase family)